AQVDAQRQRGARQLAGDALLLLQFRPPGQDHGKEREQARGQQNQPRGEAGDFQAERKTSHRTAASDYLPPLRKSSTLTVWQVFSNVRGFTYMEPSAAERREARLRAKARAQELLGLFAWHRDGTLVARALRVSLDELTAELDQLKIRRRAFALTR